MNEKQQQLIDHILDHFDFESVHIAMEALKWSWHGEGVPDIPKLRQTARRLLKEAVSKNCEVLSGGFCASYNQGTCYLHFTLERQETNMEELQ